MIQFARQLILCDIFLGCTNPPAVKIVQKLKKNRRFLIITEMFGTVVMLHFEVLTFPK